MNEYYIYQHRFKNGTVYIGKGKGSRMYDNTSRSVYWHALLNKHGEPIRGMMFTDLTEEKAFALEISVIQEYRGNQVTLCNLTDGGEGCSGYKHTNEHKQHIGTIIKNYRKQPHVKAKCRESMLGANNPMFGAIPWNKGKTKETCDAVAKQSERCKGIPKTQEHKNKLSVAKKGIKLGPLNTTKYTFINVNTKAVVTATGYEMKEKYKCGYHISSVITDKRNSHKGWKLK